MTAHPARQFAKPTAPETGLAHLIVAADRIADADALTRLIDAAVAETPPADQREAVINILRRARSEGRDTIRAAFAERPGAGLRAARSFAHLTDVLVFATMHYQTVHAHPLPIQTKGERLSVIGVGGYGRGEMAPYSDVDLLFLTPYKQTPWSESVIEDTLYMLWDLRLKVGHATRSIAECVRLAKSDLTIRTALLEQRFIYGDTGLAAALEDTLWRDLFTLTGPEFVEGKLAERDNRHERNGGSRYLLEPNLKEGKGGLRDLQTLHWVSRYLYRTGTAWDLVALGVFEQDEVQRFADAAKFIWAVRCHLHVVSGRAQEHLTFDRQTEIAVLMGYEDGDGRMAVEHFMHAYFRHAKAVGDLTRIFSAALEAQHAKPTPKLSNLLRALSFRSAQDPEDGNPFTVRDGRLSVYSDTVFEEDRVNILRLFHEAVRLDARIHPAAMRLVTQSLDLIDDDLRSDPKACALFLDMLCDQSHAEWVLRLMNETGVLGRFVPEFGRVFAMIQFNMYHHYTVDEHTIRTIGILNEIERLEAEDEHPVATEIIRAGIDRRVLYTALFCHDLGKGDPRDHSELGAEIAATLCPRLGLTDAETETVVWLVRHHLLMSDVAQKRDISDPRTVRDFANMVQSPQRLRLLLVLTVCDIRGVGPGVWNNWKAQLLRTLYWDTRDLLTGSAAHVTQRGRVEAAQQALEAEIASWPEDERKAELARHYPHYWMGLDTATHRIFAEMARDLPPNGLGIRFERDEDDDATQACLYLADHPGIFSRMAGAFAIAGANVVEARTYTTQDGMVTSAYRIRDQGGGAFEDGRLERLSKTIERTLSGNVIAREALQQKSRERSRERPFSVPTRILFDNEASDVYTVIEVNARDRLGLLHHLTRTLTTLNVNIFSAIIATYGEHAVDVFYVKDLFGLKIRSATKQRQVEKMLIEAVDRADDEAIAPS